MSSSFSCALQRVMWCVHPKQLGFSFSRREDGAGCKHLIDSSDQEKKKKKKSTAPSCKTIMLWLASSECKTYIFTSLE